MSVPPKDELKAYVEGVLCGYLATDNMGTCQKCGKHEDLRCGLCFNCAHVTCPREHCPFRKLVYDIHRQRVWADLTYTEDKVYCDRDEGVCSDREFAIGLDKELSLPPAVPAWVRFGGKKPIHL